MAWKIELDDHARRQLHRLDRPVQRRILGFLRQRVATADDPRSLERPLRGRFAGIWRYRVGDYRIMCQIEDARLVVVVLGVGHRSGVYG